MVLLNQGKGDTNVQLNQDFKLHPYGTQTNLKSCFRWFGIGTHRNEKLKVRIALKERSARYGNTKLTLKGADEYSEIRRRYNRKRGKQVMLDIKSSEK